MSEINKHEIRSPEMQEVMSEIPGSFLKWGLFLFFAIILAILGLTWFISSPDIVTAPVTITTFNPPVSLVARSGGKIGKFFVQNGDKVLKDQPVALIENQAQWNDILILERYLQRFGDLINLSSDIRELGSPVELFLGDLQDPWQRYAGLMRKFTEYCVQANIPSKLNLLDKQIVRQEEYILEMKNQELLSQEDLMLSYNSYMRDSILFDRGSYSIPVEEFERSKQQWIQKQISFSSLKSSIKNNENSILKLRENKIDLTIQYEKETNQYLSDIKEAIQILKVSLGQWKERYLIQSPVEGKISFTNYWSANQIINSGEVLAYVIPKDAHSIIIRALVPAIGSGKVKPGQAVNIKLTGYPYMESGFLKGVVSTLSLVPVKDTYIAEIKLNNGMRTNYGIELEYINGMSGTAEIITENKRLIFRFLKPVKSIVNN